MGEIFKTKTRGEWAAVFDKNDVVYSVLNDFDDLVVDPQVFVYIKGGLADGCPTFHELTTERGGNTIDIEVTTQRLRDAICTQVYGFFEKDVNLVSDFTSDETYAVNVNGETMSFVMQ